jgi:hypothetical protein
MTSACFPARLLPCLLAGLAFAAEARAAADLTVRPCKGAIAWLWGW